MATIVLQNDQWFGSMGWAADGADPIAIRDNSAHTSDILQGQRISRLLLFAINTLNQAVSIQYQGSITGANWFNLGSAISVAASTGVDAQTLSDPWVMFRAVATCSVSPASGSLSIRYGARLVAA